MMASEDDPTPFPDDDLEEENSTSSSLPNDVVSNSTSSSSSSDTDDVIPPIASPLNTVTIAIPTPSPTTTTATTTTTNLTTTLALPKPKPLPLDPTDPSRRLFQRLWTDEDEIELLNGFLEYTATKATSSSGSHHHNDTSAFYDQIKNKLQLEFNKSQLVEKLRRLKKKYRNVLSKMSTGKDFQFKSPHDQATFEISQKIWTNLSPSGNHHNAAAGGPSKLDLDLDDDHFNNHNSSNHLMMVVPQNYHQPQSQQQPQQHGFPGFNINLNSAATGGGMEVGSGGGYAPAKLSVSRKRSRPGGGGVKMEDYERAKERFVKVNLGGSEGGGVFNSPTNVNETNNNNNVGNNVGVGGAMQGMIEEAVRNCLSPVLNELVNNLKGGAGGGGGGGSVAAGVMKGIEDLAKNAMPLNFAGVSIEDGVMEEKWRKQQILELEVYSRRLELVQEQIKSSLEELRSKGG